MLVNTTGYLRTIHRALSANGIGVWKNTKVSTRVRTDSLPRFFCNTTSFSRFEQGVFPQAPSISYHLTGYGMLPNESFIRFLGESAERYTFTAASRLLGGRMVTASRKELCEQTNCHVLPLKYINIYEGMAIDECTPIAWIKMNSFCKDKQYVYIPAAIVLMGWELIKNEPETNELKSVSTGTACHQTLLKAMENSIVEYMQLDSTNIWWQCGMEGKLVDNKTVESILSRLNFDKRFFDLYDIIVTDISFDKPINIYACEIVLKDTTNNTMPKYVIGIQGGLDVDSTIYRGIMEGLTILEYACNYRFINKKHYDNIKEGHTDNFFDLDTNVIYYAKYGIPKFERKQFPNWNEIRYSTSEDLLRYVSDMYKYAGYLDITSPDFEIAGFHISRIVIPELLSLYLPSHIPTKHTRFEKYKVTNNAPHPMP